MESEMGDGTEWVILSRVMSWIEAGITLEADPRHVELILHELRFLSWKRRSPVAGLRPLVATTSRWNGPTFRLLAGLCVIERSRRLVVGEQLAYAGRERYTAGPCRVQESNMFFGIGDDVAMACLMRSFFLSDLFLLRRESECICMFLRRTLCKRADGASALSAR